jgi:molybdopterin-guanine dinucleotide biosynthesis protein B
MKNARVSLEVNGRDIPLNPFVSNIIRQIILGVLSTLKGVKSPRQIKLEVGAEKPPAEKKGSSR